MSFFQRSFRRKFDHQNINNDVVNLGRDLSSDATGILEVEIQATSDQPQSCKCFVVAYYNWLSYLHNFNCSFVDLNVEFHN